MPGSNTSLDSSFERTKTKLAKELDTIVQIALKHGQIRSKEEAASLVDKLRLTQFNLLVLGEFKRGKSTLINALLEHSIMPMGVLPLTSAVSIVSYGDMARMMLVHNDGTRELSTIESIGEFVTEEQNPHNVKEIATVEIEFPSEFLKTTGARIVDTPGIGSIHEHNTETTLKFLPNADAVLFLFAADQPASRQELDFLKLASNHAVRFFCVQNKIDYLSQAEKEVSSKFLAQVLQNELGRPLEIYALSAKQALAHQGDPFDDGFWQLRTDLLSFFSKEKSQVFFESVHLKMTSLLRNLEQALELERKAVLLSPETLANGILEFRKCASRIEAEQDDADFIVRGEAKQLISRIGEDLKMFAAKIQDELVAETELAYERNKALDKGALIIALREELLAYITKRFGAWKEEKELVVADLFDSITSRFVERGNAIVQQLRDATQALFQYELDALFEIEPLSTKSMHSYAVYDPFTLALENVPLLLPSPLAKRIIRQRFLEAARSEGSRNAGLLRADFQERIERSTSQFLTAFRKTVRQIISDIEVALSKANDRHREIDAVRRKLDDELTLDIESIRKFQIEFGTKIRERNDT